MPKLCLVHSKPAHSFPVLVVNLRLCFLGSNYIIVKHCKLSVWQLIIIAEIHLDNLWHRGNLPVIHRNEIRLIQACQTQLILDTQLKPFMKTGIIFVSLNQVAAYDADILCLRTYLIGCCKKLIYPVIEPACQINRLKNCSGKLLCQSLFLYGPA